MVLGALLIGQHVLIPFNLFYHKQVISINADARSGLNESEVQGACEMRTFRPIQLNARATVNTFTRLRNVHHSKYQNNGTSCHNKNKLRDDRRYNVAAAAIVVTERGWGANKRPLRAVRWLMVLIIACH